MKLLHQELYLSIFLQKEGLEISSEPLDCCYQVGDIPDSLAAAKDETIISIYSFCKKYLKVVKLFTETYDIHWILNFGRKMYFSRCDQFIICTALNELYREESQ